MRIWIHIDSKTKDKAIPVTGREDSLGCETSRLPHAPVALYPPQSFLVLISVRG
jgi:hypothetical protein